MTAATCPCGGDILDEGPTGGRCERCGTWHDAPPFEDPDAEYGDHGDVEMEAERDRRRESGR